MLPKASDIYTIRMLTQTMAGGIIESCDPDGQCKNRTILPKASDIYTIRMLTQPMAGGKIESCAKTPDIPVR